MSKSPLWNYYEAKVQSPVSKSAWYRVKASLMLGDELNDNDIEDIDLYVQLKSIAPRTKITCDMLIDIKSMLEFFPQQCATGADIVKVIRKFFVTEPSRMTLYRWGEDIGVPYSTTRIYAPDEVFRWAMKLWVMRPQYQESKRKKKDSTAIFRDTLQPHLLRSAR